ncbi:putative phage tail protein [Leifsonia sp. AK011]|uniref:hypothetical protein n=1 Tax=Leifsonia sp. AK011 TaxID=2723075 RepID=UPI0015C7393A|nr:hypothetical protein [Leifsonia sp. AK011]NYF09413.1 putative phage tail protein [Leifsonia sp. AK011]
MTNAGQPPYVPAPQAAAPRKTGVWQLVVGILLIFASLFSLPRGIVGVIVTLTQPGMVSPGYPLGVAMFGATLLTIGIVLVVRSARIRAENRAALVAPAVAPAPPYGPPTVPPTA